MALSDGDFEARLAALDSELTQSHGERLEVRAELLEVRSELHRISADVHRVIDALTPIQLSLEKIASLSESSAKRADLAQRNALAIAVHVREHCTRCRRSSTEKAETDGSA